MPHKHIFKITPPSKPKPITGNTEEERLAQLAAYEAEQARLARLEQDFNFDGMIDPRRIPKPGINAFFSENQND